MRRVTPMIHVPDVAATVEWYRGIGFDVLDVGRENGGGEVIWALLAFGDGRVMLSAGGRPGDAQRREVDLYVSVDDVEAVARRLEKRVEVVEGLHDTFYGTREFIIRDLNRFWITFGQETAGRTP